jgi:hypothetical protein
LSTILALESLQNEVSFIAQHSIDEGREHLNDLEVEHLIKMTSDVVSKIKNQARGLSY